MMESTAPQDFHDNIEPYIPRLSDERIATQEHVIATQVAWAEDFRARYPKTRPNMRAAHRGGHRAIHVVRNISARELGTYWNGTMALYRRFVDDLPRKGRNLTERRSPTHAPPQQVSPISPKRRPHRADAGIGALPAGHRQGTDRYVTRHGAFVRCALSLPETR